MTITVECNAVITSEPNGEIAWYVEQRGHGADVVLIPSGEGDCGSFEQVAAALSQDFRVTTFDTPGFSRSTTRGDVEISMIALSHQVAALLEALGISEATVYGCSSAGLAVLDLVTDHRQLVRHAIVHEAALPGGGEDSPLRQLGELEDAKIATACAAMFGNMMNEDPAAWTALGEEFHQRLALNYPTWIRRYVTGPEHHPIDPATLSNRPITWTIGGLFEAKMFFSNVKLAHSAGLEIELLPCRHFPQVSIPEALAGHIRQAASDA